MKRFQGTILFITVGFVLANVGVLVVRQGHAWGAYFLWIVFFPAMTVAGNLEGFLAHILPLKTLSPAFEPLLIILLFLGIIVQWGVPGLLIDWRRKRRYFRSG